MNISRPQTLPTIRRSCSHNHSNSRRCVSPVTKTARRAPNLTTRPPLRAIVTSAKRPLEMMEEIEGKSGRRYVLGDVLQDKKIAFGRVYLATNNDKRYVVKEIPQDFTIREDIYRRIGNLPHVRSPSDSLPARRMFIFPYLDENLLRLAQSNLPLSSLKRILKCALRGLAMLHERDIIHNDVKPDNILVQMEQNEAAAEIGEVRLADLEDSAHVPPGKVLRGAQLGNWMWRSPESHAMGPIEKPSDMFSFGIVCIYAMIKGVIFSVDEADLPEGVDKLAVVLEHQISYFADEDGFNGFLSYIGTENDWYEIFVVIKRGFGEEQPRRPFELWQGDGMDDCDFKDLVRGLTNFDPRKRLTAQQALSHRWFYNV